MSSIIRRRSTRTAAAVVTVGLAAGFALAGCSSDQGGGGTSGDASDIEAALEEGGTLTYWSWTPSAEAQVAAFEKEYPNVDVKLVNAGTNTEEYTKLQNAITAGSGAPDVAQVEYYAIPQFALADALVDLTAYGFADLEDDYSPGPWSSVNVNGGLYGLPQDSGPMAMFYNKTVFDANGLTVPTTWDEYIAAAKTLHEKSPDSYITSDTGDSGFTTSMIWQAGGTPFEADGTNVTIDLQDEGAKKWADTWNELNEGGLLSQTPGWSDEW